MTGHIPRCKPSAALRRAAAFLCVLLVVGSMIENTRAEPPPVFLPAVMVNRPAAECAPSYPTVCIAPYPPDLDCPDLLPLANFAAVPPDEHGLDADNDGIACEWP